MATNEELNLPPKQRANVTTAIHAPRQTWNLLRAVAFARSQRSGRRVSVSKVVLELVGKHEKELKKEAGRFLEMMSSVE